MDSYCLECRGLHLLCMSIPRNIARFSIEVSFYDMTPGQHLKVKCYCRMSTVQLSLRILYPKEKYFPTVIDDAPPNIQGVKNLVVTSMVLSLADHQMGKRMKVKSP